MPFLAQIRCYGPKNTLIGAFAPGRRASRSQLCVRSLFVRCAPNLPPNFAAAALKSETRLRFSRNRAYHQRGQWDWRVQAAASSIRCKTERSDNALWRKIVSGFVLAAFFWMSFVAQTHIHGQPSAPAFSIDKSSHNVGGSAVKGPSKGHGSDDQADCPLCQAVSHGGAVVIPLLTIALALETAVPAALAVPAPSSWTKFVDYDHQTRGPPHI
jgi:hypothetical protein